VLHVFCFLAWVTHRQHIPPPTTRPYDAPMLSSQFNSIRSPQLEGENARPHPGARLDGRCVGQLLSHLTYKGKENSSKQ
jgi:hypothetical protein